jgi:cytochrome c oxidase cbb3-type subunit IV
MDLDVNTWRSGITVLSLLLFIALMAWTLNRRRQAAFDEAAHLPFAEPAADPVMQPTESQASRSTLS